MSLERFRRIRMVVLNPRPTTYQAARVEAASASEVLRGVCKVSSESVSAGQIAEVREQLPDEMKALFPSSVRSRRP